MTLEKICFVSQNSCHRRDRHTFEMVVKINGRRMWLWRAVDDEGEVLDMLVQNSATRLSLRNCCAYC
jgi:transposase-like protein